jgi:predicted 2-oxoglutarate/Fe(II)-dependent dioxygenase YbiX
MKHVSNMKFLPAYISPDSHLTEEDCLAIIESYSTKVKRAGIASAGNRKKRIRITSAIGINLAHSIEITDCITECHLINNRHWKYEVEGKEEVQFMKYEVNGHYDWHIDIGSHRHSNRKLSFVIPLSDPDDYEGGELILKSSSKETSIPLKKGTIILFPSFMLHKVTPVTKGKRYIIAGWLNGKSPLS